MQQPHILISQLYYKLSPQSSHKAGVAVAAVCPQVCQPAKNTSHPSHCSAATRVSYETVKWTKHIWAV